MSPSVHAKAVIDAASDLTTANPEAAKAAGLLAAKKRQAQQRQLRAAAAETRATADGTTPGSICQTRIFLSLLMMACQIQEPAQRVRKRRDALCALCLPMDLQGPSWVSWAGLGRPCTPCSVILSGR